MSKIEDLSADTFQALIGQEFDCEGQTLKLTEVDSRDAPTPSLRAPFSLLFTGPEDFEPLGVMAIAHDAIGSHELLIHRIAAPDAAEFEIIFG